ncbi:MAG: hypothetical protein AB1757_03410 [Acidobacteriota bacterium]
MIGLIWFFAIAPAVFGQAQEQEPNNSCQTAQNFGSIGLPFVVSGGLTSTVQNPDVDFFRFTAAPNTKILVDLEGQSTGRGTLPDPFLGLFNSSCTLLATNDDGGYYHNARLDFTVPADGVFILGVSRCCDADFAGGGIGTYMLTIAQFVDARLISGGIVDAATGAPLTGQNYPYARAELYRCSNGQCNENVATAGTDSNGRFKFDRIYYSNPIPAGTYQIAYSAQLYNSGQSAIFTIAPGEAKELGNFSLTQVPLADSIGGRLLDSETGAPLPGNSFPFARVELRRCNNGQCYEGVDSQSTDNLGRFRFEHDYSGRPLPTGTYQAFFYANLYQPSQSAMFTVGQGENKNLGDNNLVALPLAGSISARLVDANNGQGLPGNMPPYAYAQLNRCNIYGCYQTVAYRNPDSLGRIQFDRDYSGNPLLAGQYQISISAQYYRQTRSEIFEVPEGQNKNLGDIRVPPLPVRFSNIQQCSSIPSGGGSCTFSVNLTNGLPSTLFAKGWILVSTYGSGLNNLFQLPAIQIISIPTGATKPMQFRLDVPDSVPDNSVMCPSLYVGQASSLDPRNDKNASFFNLLGQTNLFCIVKRQGTYNVLTVDESRTLLRSLTPQPSPDNQPKK